MTAANPLAFFTGDQINVLGDNLDPKHVKTLKEGSKASYIEGWHAIAEANRIFGFGAWDLEVIRCEQTNRELVEVKRQVNNKPVMESQWRVGYLYVVRVSVYGQDGLVCRREGTGFGSGYAKENALGEAIESAAKEAETDATKRAMRTFGNKFGLALYDKTKANVGPSQLEDPETPEERPAPPAAQLKIAEKIIGQFGKTDDAGELWKDAEVQKYLKKWHKEPHDLYERIGAAAKAAKARIEKAAQEGAANDDDDGVQDGQASDPRDPFNDEIPF